MDWVRLDFRILTNSATVEQFGRVVMFQDRDNSEVPLGRLKQVIIVLL